MKRTRRSFYTLIGTALPLCFGSHALAQNTAETTSIPVADMGVRKMGETYPLKLTAQNIDCDVAQTFEFEVDGGAWFIPPQSTTISGLTKGQKGTIKATMDFSNITPGIYYGHVASRCTSCGWYIMTACVESGEDTVFKVTVIDPAKEEAAQVFTDPPNPFANLRPYQPPQIELLTLVSEDDFGYLTKTQKKRLSEARKAVIAAEQIGRKARENARLARKDKTDCERELAKLKLKADTAKRKSTTAKQDANNADGAAKAAAKTLRNFQRDNRKALNKIGETGRGVQVAVKYLNIVKSEDTTGSERIRKAQEQVDRFQKNHFDALREHSAIIKSEEQRKKSAEQSRKDAETAKAKAETANNEAKKAQEAYDEKMRECKGLKPLIAAADKKVQDAKDAAEDAVKKANQAEKDAKRQVDRARAKEAAEAETARLAAVKAAEDARLAAIKQAEVKRKTDLDNARKEKKRCDADVKAYSKYLTQLFKATRDLTNMDKRKITDKDLNVEVTALDMVAEFAKTAGKALIDEFNPVPTGETAFTALKAGYDIMKIKQLEYTSGRALYRGHDIQSDRLKEKGYAKSKAEGMKMAKDMDRIVAANGDTRFFYKELGQKIARCHNLGVKINALKAKKGQ